jgi:hypothetical protein
MFPNEAGGIFRYIRWPLDYFPDGSLLPEKAVFGLFYFE